MKVLQINSTLNWGSTGRIAEEIGQEIMAAGGESHIAYGRYANSSQSNSIRIGGKWEVYFHVLYTRLFDGHGLVSLKATKQLIERIRVLNPDIIHLHNIHGYYLNYPMLFEFLVSSNIPVVWTLHDCWAFTGHCSHYSFTGCYRWKKKCYSCPQIKMYPQSWGIDNSESNFKKKSKIFTSIKNLTLVPVSKWLSKEVEQSFLKNIPIRTINNGIDVDVFTSSSINKYELGLENKFTILGVANVWNNRKGLNDYITLRDKLSDDFQIVLIGLSERQIKKMPNGIKGIGRTNSIQELVSYYSVSDVYINFSVEESLGLTTCEAMACGTPAIVYNCTACPEVVSPDTGFIVNQGDFEGVLAAINIIKEKRKETYAKACRERVSLHYNKRISYAEYLQLYNEILNRK